ncbi:hypothetical protein GQR58_018568 [Nymphon striatum]|nr:hypothetical protein GQR58_018568 [Nymphon striatum]
MCALLFKMLLNKVIGLTKKVNRRFRKKYVETLDGTGDQLNISHVVGNTMKRFPNSFTFDIRFKIPVGLSNYFCADYFLYIFFYSCFQMDSMKFSIGYPDIIKNDEELDRIYSSIDIKPNNIIYNLFQLRTFIPEEHLSDGSRGYVEALTENKINVLRQMSNMQQHSALVSFANLDSLKAYSTHWV